MQYFSACPLCVSVLDDFCSPPLMPIKRAFIGQLMFFPAN
jgi:hypothetical protein